MLSHLKESERSPIMPKAPKVHSTNLNNNNEKQIPSQDKLPLRIKITHYQEYKIWYLLKLLLLLLNLLLAREMLISIGISLVSSRESRRNPGNQQQ